MKEKQGFVAALQMIWLAVGGVAVMIVAFAIGLMLCAFNSRAGSVILKVGIAFWIVSAVISAAAILVAIGAAAIASYVFFLVCRALWRKIKKMWMSFAAPDLITDVIVFP